MENKELVYGEISTIGMKQFAQLEPNCENFMDVGSGYGKFTWVMGSFFNATNSYGIEIDADKYWSSKKYFEARYNPNIHFRLGDFRKYKQLISRMDVVYSHNRMWLPETVKELVDCLGTCNFYHDNFHYHKIYNIPYEVVKLHVNWARKPINFYKINTNEER